MPAMSARGQRLLADLASFIVYCEEANALLDFAERAPQAIEWHPENGQSLREALRKAMAHERGGE